MKKNILQILATILILCALLSGCKAKVECDFCNEIKRCNTTTFLGEEVYICDDCQADFDELLE